VRWELVVAILVALGSATYLVRWLLQHAEREDRHYTKRVRANHATCACGFYSHWDYDLRKHFAEQERAGK
jgi:hypothetical protein